MGEMEEDKEWEEEVRKKCSSILRYENELKRLYKLYKGLPTAYKCPFCGFISYKPLNKKIEVWVHYSIYFGDDSPWSKKLIDFCDCPRCKTTAEKYIRDGIRDVDVDKVKAKKVKVMTKEYKQLLNDLSTKMKIRVYQNDYGLVCEGDGFKIYEAVDEIVCETEAGLDYCLEELPEDVGKLMWTIYYLLGGQIPMVDEDAVEVRPE